MVGDIMKITIDEEKLYELIKRAVAEALQEYDYVLPSQDDMAAREVALQEQDAGETVDWDEYYHSKK
jgi:hypothetical protein